MKRWKGLRAVWNDVFGLTSPGALWVYISPPACMYLLEGQGSLSAVVLRVGRATEMGQPLFLTQARRSGKGGGDEGRSWAERPASSKACWSQHLSANTGQKEGWVAFALVFHVLLKPLLKG